MNYIELYKSNKDIHKELDTRKIAWLNKRWTLLQMWKRLKELR